MAFNYENPTSYYFKDEHSSQEYYTNFNNEVHYGNDLGTGYGLYDGDNETYGKTPAPEEYAMSSYDPETEEDYSQDPNYQEEVEEQWQREIGEEQWNREEVGQEFNGGEEFGEELAAQDWGEEGDAKDWENGELEQGYALEA